MSNLGCGLNGALYFVEMEADGGKSKYPGNKAGDKCLVSRIIYHSYNNLLYFN